MSKVKILTIVLCAAMGISICARGEDSATVAANSTQTKLIYMDNAMCPVSDDEIEGTAPVRVEYNGRVYNLCCEPCAKHFRKFPERFSRKTAGEE